MSQNNLVSDSSLKDSNQTSLLKDKYIQSKLKTENENNKANIQDEDDKKLSDITSVQSSFATKQMSLDEMKEKQLEILKEHRQICFVKYMFVIGCAGITFLLYNNNFQGLLQQYIMEDCKIDDIQFQLFQTLSGGPTVPLIFVGGIVSDIIGISYGIIIYATFSVIGMILVALGGYLTSFVWLLVGRIIYNIGMQMTAAAAISLLAKWFQGPELTKFSSLQQGFVKLGLVASSYVYPRLYPVYDNLFFPLLIGAIIAVVFYAVGMTAPILDILGDNKVKRALDGQIIKGPKKPKFSFSHFKQFNWFFWLIITTFIINSAINYTFLTNVYKILNPKFKVSQEEVGNLLAIANIVGLFSPIIGIIMKKTGGFYSVLVIGSVFQMAQFLYFIIAPACEESCYYQMIPPIILFGVFMTLFTVVLIPAVAQNSPAHLKGTAFGTGYALKNGGQALLPIISVGPMLKAYNVIVTMWFMFSISALCFILSVILYIIQRKKDQEKKRFQEQEEALLAQDTKVEELEQQQDDEEEPGNYNTETNKSRLQSRKESFAQQQQEEQEEMEYQQNTSSLRM